MILGLDIATHTGVAWGNEGNIAFATRDFGAFNYDHAVMGRIFSKYLCRKIQEVEPDVIVIEKPFLRNEKTSYFLSGLVWEAHRAAELFGIPRYEYPPIQIKKFITGNGKAKKEDVIHAMKCNGYKPRSDHEADAGAALLLHESIMRSNNG